ncbi:hypothetical protein NQ317_007428 [Molorchus minor]|uniref:Uncharacterized protein n=1 Tax=Molorchus minor TaxID=1323400 RepID=A0ABQ9JGB3_9CUCU|nr:hypothetical protein NQ317_007428 [Molorchus minor]
MCRNTDLARGRYKCTESIYVLHIPVLYTEHFVKLVRKAYIDRKFIEWGPAFEVVVTVTG